jgi:hypothetical protein
MKRTVIVLSLIFALAIALSASIPTLAATATAGTAITGTLASKVEISAPASYSLGALPATVPSAVTVNVKCNKGWTLTAQAPKMTDGVNTLQNALEGAKHLGTYAFLDTVQTIEPAGAKTGASGVNTAVDLRQTIVDYVDAATDTTPYSTTITFTVTY